MKIEMRTMFLSLREVILLGSCTWPRVLMLADMLGSKVSKPSVNRLGSTKKTNPIAKVPKSSRYKGSWVDSKVIQGKRKKARLMVVEDEPKKGMARKDSRGNGMVRSDDS